LDYPPLFAHFEYGLSKFAHYFDVAMLDVNNLNYASEKTKLFQRLTVIISDIVLAFAILS
jgi:alpha-1,3-glucosyltransferase